MEIVNVTDLQRLGGYRLRPRFDDGAGGELDFSDEEWKGIFAPLNHPAYFLKVELDEELGTIVWPNGADFAPETLHRMVVEQQGSAAASS
ncbi:MAG: DUF2442 domain-containing protein [Solirubrobacterales bacterium]